MRESEVNRLIREEVDSIEDKATKQFIREILSFEREHMDLDQPHYKSDFKELIEEYAPDESPDREDIDV
jgi:hypothetical protein